jgi:glycosyltransferase involved in cell wall biosynthesis
MKFSILTPAYNADKYLTELLTSVRGQQFEDVEHIVIDDGSTDNTLKILEEFGGVKVRHQANRGQYATQNELLKLASGDVLAVICADDHLADSGVLGRVAAAFRSDPLADVVVGRTPRKVEGSPTYVVRPDVPLWVGARTVRSCLAVQHCSVFVKRDLVSGQSIEFDERYRMRGDWDWLIRVFAAAQRVKILNQDLAVWRHHPGQTSVTAQVTGDREVDDLLSQHDISERAFRRLRRIYGAYSRLAHVTAIGRQHGAAAALRQIRLSVDARGKTRTGV